MTFKKGQSGNPKGAPQKPDSLSHLMREFLNSKPKGSEKTYREMFIQKTFQQAMQGDVTCQKYIWQYQEGMPAQKTDVTSNGEKIEGFQIIVQKYDEED